YDTAGALADDLGRFLRGEPVRARRTGPLGRAGRWCRRNPALAALTAAVAVLLVALAAGSTAAAVWLRYEREVAVGAEAERADKLWDAPLARARLGRSSGQVGQRLDSLKALAEAAALRPDPQLRNEAIACLALFDLRTVREWPDTPTGTG